MNAALFEQDAPSYASTNFPAPRAFQSSAHDSLRAGIAAGNKNQMVMAPTGAGKSYLGLRIAHEALLKGKKVIFVCDRTTLINQTSEAADQYGLSAHGIIQSNHWRFNPEMPFQIASAQTLKNRGWPDADVIIIDEAHTQMSVWTEHIPTCRAAVIGLSATPFSDGLGKLFTNLINATTMHDLTQSGVLVPMRVFSCTKANMDGAATAGGEWTDKAAEERGMAIIGNVVMEWTKHAEDRKTIVFGATINHCEEISRQFNEVGIMSAVFTSKTDAAERALLLNEYKKPDSALKILVSVEALAKGFDVPTVGCVVDCRPLRKSLSTAIQMWGRGLRSSPESGKTDCLARDTLVLTDKGEVKIQNITLDHLVWDGHNFVCHAGAICKGVQKVIEYDGLIATPDHEVMTNDGWKRIEEAKSRQLRITRTGFGGNPIRLVEDRDAKDARQRVQFAGGSGVRSLFANAFRAVSQHSQATGYSGLPALQCAQAGNGSAMALQALSSANAALLQSELAIVRAIRRTWNRISFLFGQRSCDLGSGKHWNSRKSSNATRPQGQQRALRAGESELVVGGGEHEQHPSFRQQNQIHSVQKNVPAREIRGCDSLSDDCSGNDIRGDKRTVAGTVLQTEREVWDVLNAGPLQRFTANGRLVHNCILLDHSGNILRFMEDFSDIYYNGLDALDAGDKLDKAIRRDNKEKEPKGCPVCGYFPFAKRCISCGHEHQAPALIESESGEMREVMIGKKKLADDTRHLWDQLCTYAAGNSAPEKQKGRASHLYKDITGEWPPAAFRFDPDANTPITKNVMNKIRSKNIAFQKARAIK